MFSDLLEGKGETAVLETNDIAAILEEAFFKPSMPQRSASISRHDGKEIENSTSYDSNSSSGIARSKLNLPNVSTSSFSFVAMPVMTTNALAMEEQLAILTKTIEALCKMVEDRDVQMASMMNKIESLGESNQATDNRPKLQDVTESSAKQ